MSDLNWLGITQAQMADELRTRFQVDEVSIGPLSERFSTMSPSLQKDFALFWKTGEANRELSVNGYSLNFIITEKRMSPLGAFGVLDWLIKEPGTAARAMHAHISR